MQTTASLLSIVTAAALLLGAPAYAADVDQDGWDESIDCDDSDPNVNPGADELCDSVDNDCDGSVDEDAVDPSTFYADQDGDGFGDASGGVASCEQPTGYVADGSDCDDGDANVNPGADELCDFADNDCDGSVDEEGAVDASTFYADADGDGYGDASASYAACEAPNGYVADSSDCDDGDELTSPDADELCDLLDNDCDGSVDEDAVDASTFYADVDGDSYGDPASTYASCEVPSGYVADGSDCDDSQGSVHPGASEVCDGLDNDCDGDDDEGLLGTDASCAAESCEALLTEEPATPSGSYYIDVGAGGELTACDMDTDGGGWTQVISWSGVEGGDDLDDLGDIFTTEIDDMGVMDDSSGSVAWCDDDLSSDALSLLAPIDVANDGEVRVDVQVDGVSMEGSGLFIAVDDGSAEHDVVCSDDVRRNRYDATALSYIPSDYSCANSDQDFSWDGEYSVDAQADVSALRLVSLMRDRDCQDEVQLHALEVWVR